MTAFILTCFGLTQILLYGSVLNKVRPDIRLFKCSMCLGFWVGLLVYAVFWAAGMELFAEFWTGLVAFGFIASGTTYILDRLIDDEGLNINN